MGPENGLDLKKSVGFMAPADNDDDVLVCIGAVVLDGLTNLRMYGQRRDVVPLRLRQNVLQLRRAHREIINRRREMWLLHHREERLNKRHWFHAKPANDRVPTRENSLSRREGLELSKAELDIAEAQRRIARQIVLIGEFAERGEPILEPERALGRLETRLLESRDRHQRLLHQSEGRSDQTGTSVAGQTTVGKQASDF